MVYHKLPDRVGDPGPLLGVMRTCRQAMIRASSTVKPMGATYHGLSMVVAAVDALATLMTGRREYFWTTGGCATVEERKQVSTDLSMESDREAPQK
jgi:hypothetical protein